MKSELEESLFFLKGLSCAVPSPCPLRRAQSSNKANGITMRGHEPASPGHSSVLMIASPRTEN